MRARAPPRPPAPPHPTASKFNTEINKLARLALIEELGEDMGRAGFKGVCPKRQV